MLVGIGASRRGRTADILRFVGFFGFSLTECIRESSRCVHAGWAFTLEKLL